MTKLNIRFICVAMIVLIGLAGCGHGPARDRVDHSRRIEVIQALHAIYAGDPNDVRIRSFTMGEYLADTKKKASE